MVGEVGSYLTSDGSDTDEGPDSPYPLQASTLNIPNFLLESPHVVAVDTEVTARRSDGGSQNNAAAKIAEVQLLRVDITRTTAIL